LVGTNIMMQANMNIPARPYMKATRFVTTIRKAAAVARRVRGRLSALARVSGRRK
jgi:hypothetical protein